MKRLDRIVAIIWDVDSRCMAVDTSVSKTQDEITDEEMLEIYDLANGRRKP